MNHTDKKKPIALTTSEKFVLFGLSYMSSQNSNGRVLSTVSNLCKELRIPDKTLLSAIKVLRNKKLIKRRKVRTKLGAWSFSYEVNSPTHNNNNANNLDAQFQQILFGKVTTSECKLTINQRLLLLACFEVKQQFGIVTMCHIKTLSKLTDLKPRNIYPNLKKLYECKLLEEVKTETTEHKRRASAWAFEPVLLSRKYSLRMIFESSGWSNLDLIKTLYKNKEFLRELTSDSFVLPDENKRLFEYINNVIKPPFLTPEGKIDLELLKAIEESADLWNKLIKSRGTFSRLKLVVISTSAWLLVNEQQMIDNDSYALEMPEGVFAIVSSYLESVSIITKPDDCLIQVILAVSLIVARALLSGINSIANKNTISASDQTLNFVDISESITIDFRITNRPRKQLYIFDPYHL
jgi:DNA-binding MarR family transcriptional regulator